MEELVIKEEVIQEVEGSIAAFYGCELFLHKIRIHESKRRKNQRPGKVKEASD